MSVQSKHLINAAQSLVADSLTGLCALNPQLGLDIANRVVFVKDHDRNKVALVCGGGSGHEPAHAAYVGAGMLTAAVCGHIFASPNASQVRRGIDLVDNDRGTVIIVKNYTGDILNFGLAKEQYAAGHPDKAGRLRFVVVGDDVAVGRTQGNIVGRRGLAGTILVYKIAGALASQGSSLDDVHAIAEWVASNVVTIGASLGHVHVPGTAPLSSNLADTEVEIGMGIHNEAGNKKDAPLPTLATLIAQLLDYLTSTTDPERSFLPFKGDDDVVLLINNLGAISELELASVVAESRKQLEERGFKIARVLSGTFMTSLNMPGFSLTLLLLPKPGDKPTANEVLSLLDSKPQVPSWPWTSNKPPIPLSSQVVQGSKTQLSASNILHLKPTDSAGFVNAIRSAAQALIAAEPDITRMDSIAGDGDCGLTLKAGAQAILDEIEKGNIDKSNIVSSLITISRVSEEAMGGTSGALYSIFFSGLVQGFQSQDIPSDSTVTLDHWRKALRKALDNLYGYTRARPPSRTLVDPLAAFIDALEGTGDDSATFSEAVNAASVAAEATKDLDAKAGRSAYVQGESLKKEQVPDPGAWGVKTVLEHLGAF